MIILSTWGIIKTAGIAVICIWYYVDKFTGKTNA